MFFVGTRQLQFHVQGGREGHNHTPADLTQKIPTGAQWFHNEDTVKFVRRLSARRRQGKIY